MKITETEILAAHRDGFITDAELAAWTAERITLDHAAALVAHCICGRFETCSGDDMAAHQRTEHGASYGL